MPIDAYLNRIATAVPPHDVHRFFLGFAASILAGDPRRQAVFERMAEKGGIDHRFSCFAPAADPRGTTLDQEGDFVRGHFPGTARRMELFRAAAPGLAARAVEELMPDPEERAGVSHLIVTCCTGFSAPGIDLDIVRLCGLPSHVERTIVGFMGCYAALNALKLARHIVRSEPEARVLVVNVELCTLHLNETADFETLVSFGLWGDGAAAALVTAEPAGFCLDGFQTLVADDNRRLMTWDIRDNGFSMMLSGQVPAAIHAILDENIGAILRGREVSEVDLWAVHPGGRSVLDAVQRALALDAPALHPSREVLRAKGNMSSATVMFVLERLLGGAQPGALGCGMAFGPGLTTETMLFRAAA